MDAMSSTETERKFLKIPFAFALETSVIFEPAASSGGKSADYPDVVEID
jgi:hypothetical protein